MVVAAALAAFSQLAVRNAIGAAATLRGLKATA
jgi:hypothetical protein